jgi:phage recombination protein Bet
MSSNAIAKREDANLASVLDAYTSEQVEMIRRTVAQGANDIQIKLFLEFCQRRGLDPITKQVYWTPKGIITAIDGFRAKAEETGCYRPGATVEIRDDQHRLLAVDVTVYKKSDNEWWPVTERAYRDEYDAGTPVWKRMPYVMTAKCAEARAIRRAFPQHFGGMYAAEELERANDGEAREASKPRTEGLIDRIRAARPEVADALEMHMPRTAPAEPEALDADELDQFAEAVAVDDLREEPVETYIGEAGAEELAGLIKNAYGAKAIGKASDRISEKYGRPSLEWLTPLEAAQVRETIAADRAAKAAKATAADRAAKAAKATE